MRNGNSTNDVMGDFWVFGYGSLIWNPGFDYESASIGTLYGLHRSMCVYSWVHRGTERNPGLVLGLDRGGSCKGIAYKVSGDIRKKVINYLRERELVTNVYRETWRKIHLGDDKTIRALTYMVDNEHPQYCSNHEIDTQIKIINHAKGRSGHNRDYVLNTIEHLNGHNIKDLYLGNLANALMR